jgi:hypothetical protein
MIGVQVRYKYFVELVYRKLQARVVRKYAAADIEKQNVPRLPDPASGHRISDALKTRTRFRIRETASAGRGIPDTIQPWLNSLQTKIAGTD